MTELPLRNASATAMADSELVLRVLNGARDSFGVLVTRYQQSLYRYACGMGLDHDTALDLTQDSLVRAWTRLAECRDPGQFRSWLFRILRNICLDHLKNLRQRSVSLDALVDAGRIPDSRTGTDRVVGLEVADALAALTPQLREAFLLKHDAGYSYEETAEIVGASPAAVKMRVHRAREALHAFLVGPGTSGYEA